MSRRFLDLRPTWHDIAKQIYLAGDFGEHKTAAHHALHVMAQTLSEKYATEEREKAECWGSPNWDEKWKGWRR